MQLWIVEHFHLHKKVPVLMNHNTWKNHMLWFTDYGRPVRKSSSLHSTKPTPAPKIFWVRPKHILSATLAQIFRFLKFMPSLGVRSLWAGCLWSSSIDTRTAFQFCHLIFTDWFCLVLLKELMSELQLCKSPDCNSSFPHTLIKTGPMELTGTVGIYLHLILAEKLNPTRTIDTEADLVLCFEVSPQHPQSINLNTK